MAGAAIEDGIAALEPCSISNSVKGAKNKIGKYNRRCLKQ